jgi:hypothetical protein
LRTRTKWDQFDHRSEPGTQENYSSMTGCLNDRARARATHLLH